MANPNSRCNKNVTFSTDAMGFTFTPSPMNKSPLVKDDSDRHWRNFGSLSKSEFSYYSDRSSFAASLNTLTEENTWLMNGETQDFVPPQSSNEDLFDTHDTHGTHLTDPLSDGDMIMHQFTFGSSDPTPNGSNASNTPNSVVTSPSFKHRYSSSAKSITFSNTVSLFSQTEKRQNSMLFYDLWGVKANPSSASSNSGSSILSETNTFGLDGLDQFTSEAINTRFRQCSTLVQAPIDEESEGSYWSTEEDFEDETGGTKTIVTMQSDDDDESKVNSNNNDTNDTNKKKVQFGKDTKDAKRKKSSGIFGYRKRKSVATDNFIFGDNKSK